MNELLCPHCGQPCEPDGVQPNLVSHTVSTLATCHNETCEMYRGTYSFNPRPMNDAECAEADERLAALANLSAQTRRL
jgi:hypothetical protein